MWRLGGLTEMRDTALGLVIVLLLFLFAVSGRPASGCPDGELNYDHPGACY